MGDETDDDTFDLVIEDIDPDDFIALMGAVGTMQFEAFAANSMERAKQSGELLKRLLMENPDLARAALLGSGDAEHIHVAQMPDDVLEELNIEIINGHIRDAEATEVEIE